MNSLPAEVRARKAGMAALVENAARTPNARAGEKRYGIPSGFISEARYMPGGSVAVEVNTLAVKSVGMPIGNASEVSYDDVPMDQFGRNARLSNSFKEFYVQTVGRIPIREIGPKAGYLGAPGIYPDDFPHQPGYRPRRVRGDDSPFRSGQPRPSYSRGPAGEVRIHPDTSCDVAHPGFTHDDWTDQEEEEERYGARLYEQRRHESAMIRIQERQYKNHYGLLCSCASSHPGASHATWRQG